MLSDIEQGSGKRQREFQIRLKLEHLCRRAGSEGRGQGDDSAAPVRQRFIASSFRFALSRAGQQELTESSSCGCFRRMRLAAPRFAAGGLRRSTGFPPHIRTWLPSHLAQAGRDCLCGETDERSRPALESHPQVTGMRRSFERYRGPQP